MPTVSSEAEVRELAEYLQVDVGSLRGPFRVIDADCPRCGRRTTFLDFVKTAVSDGAHERSRLADILTGRAGTWLPREVATVAARCDQALRRPNTYSEYSSSSYAYA